MSETEDRNLTPAPETAAPEPPPAATAALPADPAADGASAAPPAAPDAEPAAPAGAKPASERGPRPDRGPKPERAPRPERGPKTERSDKPEQRGDARADRSPGGADRGRPMRGRDDRRPAGRPPDLMLDIDLEKLVHDSLYLDNQAHTVVARMRDMDSGTRSQLRRLFSATRRACRAAEADRQHQFVMLRARLAYTIARHQLRSLDPLEKLLLQVTRKNDARGYERFRDLFEAIVAYNE